MAFACRHAWSAAGEYTRIGTDGNLRVASNCTFHGHKFRMKKKKGEKIKYRVSPSTWIPDFCIHQHYYRYITDTCTAVQDTKEKNGPNNSKKTQHTHIFPKKNRHDMIPHWLIDRKWFIFKKKKKNKQKRIEVVDKQQNTNTQRAELISLCFFSYFVYEMLAFSLSLDI